MSWPAEKPKENGLTHLASGESLLAEQWISSPNDQARLMLEGNGNLTIFKLKGKPHVVRFCSIASEDFALRHRF